MSSERAGDALVEWYMQEIAKRLRIQDTRQKDNVLSQVRPTIVEASKLSSSKKDMISNFGDPVTIARELSDPRNWEIDLGSPISPQKTIKPFFSSRGGLILSLMFMLGLVIPFGLFIFRPEYGWVLPGVLLSFVTVWALGVSFLNNYLGYLGTANDLKNSDMKISTIDIVTLKKHVIMFSGIAVIISFLLGSTSILLDPGVYTIAIPITLSTISASVVACFLIFKEGKNVLS